MGRTGHLNESSTSGLHGASPKTWSKSLDSRLIGNGYESAQDRCTGFIRTISLMVGGHCS